MLRTLLVIILMMVGLECQSQPIATIDLANVNADDGTLRRVYGSVGNGSSGVPVAGGFDVDGDGSRDYAFAAMRASPDGRTSAGQVFLVFGDGTIQGEIDTAVDDPRVLTIWGDHSQENAGSEIWMADVTGDGLGDLLICRQNFSPAGRIGAGAISILPGSALLRTLAMNNTVIDLRSPAANLQITTLVGANASDRLCIWARNGDLTGDNIDDIAVGADRQTQSGQSDSGAVYVIRGGSHLMMAQTVDLADFGSTALPGNLARIRPRAPSVDHHFGATVQIADLDGNGLGEVLAATTLNRAGASLPPPGGSGNGSGGSPQGTLFIAWDDNFGGDWLPVLDFVIDNGPGSFTAIDGGNDNDAFGEELLGGLDYDNNGNADLFIGDLTADGTGAVNRPNAGLGHIIYNAFTLKGLDFDLDSPPAGFNMATLIGPVNGAIAADTAMHGDFNGDGIDDLAIASPHATPFGRINGGTLHILLGRNGFWPLVSDLAPVNFPDSSQIEILEVHGAKGRDGANEGDTLSYSGADGDLNGDGIIDIITNEMVGDGVAPGTNDVGNLIVLSGGDIFPELFKNGFEGLAPVIQPKIPDRRSTRRLEQ